MTTVTKSPEVAYFNTEELPDAVEASLSDDCDLVVVRGLLKSKRIRRKLHRRVTNLSGAHLRYDEGEFVASKIPRLTEARAVIRKWIERHGEVPPPVLASHYELQPDTLRCGPIGAHLDLANVITSVSVNMCDESIVYAQRLCSSDVVDKTTRDEVIKKFETTGKEMRARAHLLPGDAMVAGRGVLHRVEASYDRVALLLSSRETAL